MFLVLAASGSGDVPFEASLDEIGELEQGFEDLLDGERLEGSADYWDRIREKILKLSSTSDLSEAIQEWSRDGSPWAKQDGVCELCGHTPIIFHYPIKNKVTGSRLVIGSECAYNYRLIESKGKDFGFESRADLKSKIQRQIKLLTKKGEESTSKDFDIAEEVVDLERALRSRLKAVLGPQDLHMVEYRNTLLEAQQVGNILKTNYVGFKAGEEALKATRNVIKFQDDLKFSVSSSLSKTLDTIVQQKDQSNRLAGMQRFKSLLSDLFSTGKPTEVIDRMWEAIRIRREELAEEIEAKVDEARAKLSGSYADEVLMVKPFPHLHFTLSTGLSSYRRELDTQSKKAIEVILGDDFVDQVKKNKSLGPTVNVRLMPDLAYGSSSLSRAAYQVVCFLGEVDKGMGGINKVIRDLYSLKKINDGAGVRVSLLRAADEGIIDSDVDGVGSLKKFAALVTSKDDSVREIIEYEVDDLVTATKSESNPKVWEVMSKDLGVDVRKAFKLFSFEDSLDRSFCAAIYKAWVAGRKPSPAEMGTLKKRSTSRSRSKEIEDSVWKRMYSTWMSLEKDHTRR